MLRGLKLTTLFVFSMTLSSAVVADDLEQELDLLYQKQIEAEKMIQGQKKPQETSAVNAAPSVQVNVVPAQTQTQVQAQAEPTKEATIYQFPASQVEASPLNQSRADQLRKARQEIELQTEQAIVEQLEAQRLEWERKRAEALLKSMQQTLNPAEPKVEVVQPVQQPVVVAPAPAPAQEVAHYEEKDEDDDHKGKDRDESSLRAKLEFEPEPNHGKDEYYMFLGAGLADYNANIVNIQADGTWGIGFGFKSAANIVFEFSFLHSMYRFESLLPTGGFSPFAAISDVNQYNLGAAIKYTFFSGRVRPLLGGLVSYTRREYSDLQCYGFACQGDAETNAFDIGGLIGGEVLVNDNFGVGLEYQYYRNLTNRNDSTYQNTFVFNPGNRLEDEDYSIWTVRGRITF